jgi:putative DNA primase/helicase
MSEVTLKKLAGWQQEIFDFVAEFPEVDRAVVVEHFGQLLGEKGSVFAGAVVDAAVSLREQTVNKPAVEASPEVVVIEQMPAPVLAARVGTFSGKTPRELWAEEMARQKARDERKRAKAALVTPKPEPDPDPPQPEVAEPDQVEEPEAEELPLAAEFGPLVLDPGAPLDNAREFARRRCHRGGLSEVWFWQEQFWRWNGQYYTAYSKEAIRGDGWNFLESAVRKYTEAVRFKPRKTHIDEMLDCLKSSLPLECSAQLWLDTREDAKDWVVFKNGVVNVLTGDMRPLSHRLWAQSGLDFDWLPEAECPTWQWFLEDVFPGDAQSQQFVEEWAGYCMTGETKFEKAAMFIGPKRSGKSTIAHVIGRLVGDGAYVGLSFNDWLATPKAAQTLIGKRLGVFADVRLKQGRAYGQNYDPGGIDHRSSELLLKTIGRDKVSIGRMYGEAWNGVLQIKFMLISNEVPNFNDPAGTAPTRFVKIEFPHSKFGKEKIDLRARLDGELGGIAARCVAAYRRLCQRGAFVQPDSSARLETKVQAASDPFLAMVHECFVWDGTSTVSKDGAWLLAERWCFDNKRPDARVAKNKFGARLREVPGFEHLADAPRPHAGQRAWFGLRVRKDCEPLEPL